MDTILYFVSQRIEISTHNAKEVEKHNEILIQGKTSLVQFPNIASVFS
jgi:hypothetical protein